MNAPALEPLLGDGFQAVATLDDTRLSVAFSGSGDMKAIALLADYLTRVHEEALRHAVSEVRCTLSRACSSPAPHACSNAFDRPAAKPPARSGVRSGTYDLVLAEHVAVARVVGLDQSKKPLAAAARGTPGATTVIRRM